MGKKAAPSSKLHPANSHVSFKSGYTDAPHHYLKKTQLNIDTLAADITGLSPPLQQILCFSHCFASSSLIFVSLDGSGAALPAAACSSMKGPFIAHLRTKEGLHRRYLRPFGTCLQCRHSQGKRSVASAKKRGPCEIKRFHDVIVGQCQILGA